MIEWLRKLMAENGKTHILPVKHTSYVLHRLNEQRRKGIFCDATLIVEGEKFPVHRSFLAANSDYFLSLFTSAEEQHNFVLAGVPLQGFRVILDFIYTSTFVLDLSNIQDVHKASSALDFTHVQSACEKVYLKINEMKQSVPGPIPTKRRPDTADLTIKQMTHNGTFHQTRDSPSEEFRVYSPLLRETAFPSNLIPKNGKFSPKEVSTSSPSSPVGNKIGIFDPQKHSPTPNQYVPLKVKRKIKEEPDVRSMPDQCSSEKRFKVSPLPSQLSPDDDVETSPGECEESDENAFSSRDSFDSKQSVSLSDRQPYSDEDVSLDGASWFQKYKQVPPEIQTFYRGAQKSSSLKKVPDLVRSTENKRGPKGSDPELKVRCYQLTKDHSPPSGTELANVQQPRVSPSSPYFGTSPNNSDKQAGSCFGEEAASNMPSKWNPETANEQGSARMEAQGKVLRNRRKMLKTSKVCSYVD